MPAEELEVALGRTHPGRILRALAIHDQETGEPAVS